MKVYYITMFFWGVLNLSAQKYASIVAPEELAKQKDVLVENFPH